MHGRLPRKKAVAEVQLNRLTQEDEILFPEWLVQAEVTPDCFTFKVCGLGAGHHEYRVADHIETGEHQCRHDQYNQPRLQQATNNGGGHDVLRGPASCLEPASSDRPALHNGRHSSWPIPTSQIAAARSRSRP